MKATSSKLYNEIIKSIEPLDLIVFRGADFVSNTISRFQRLVLGSGEFTHVGIVINKEMFPYIDQLENDKYYVWESTMSIEYIGSGELTPDIVSNEGKLGIQIRELEDVIRTYTISENASVAVCSLKNNPWKNISNRETIKETMSEIYNKYGNKYYERSCCHLLGSLFTIARPFRDNFDRITVKDHEVIINYQSTPENKWYFCSEFTALIYKKLGILSENINIKDVAPMDLLGYDLDNNIDIVEHPIYIKLKQ